MSLLDRILGTPRSDPGFGGQIFGCARLLARAFGHGTVDIVHVVWTVSSMEDVKRGLERQGVHVDDVSALLDQLVVELPRTDWTGRDDLPTAGPVLGKLPARTEGFFRELGAVLPPELALLRRPVPAIAHELDGLFESRLSTTKGGGLTLEGWDPLARQVTVGMQQFIDRHRLWYMVPAHLFVAILGMKRTHDAFAARGIDVKALIRELGATYDALPVPMQDAPVGWQPPMHAALLALLRRAERYAAEDRIDVGLRHLLAALHDERRLAPFVERLTSS